MQAKIEKQKKDTQYASESLKYWNRETSYTRGKHRIGTGLSRAQSDVYSRAMATLGTARKYEEGYAKERFGVQRHSDETGVSYSSRRNLGKYQQILAKQAQIESSINNTFGQNWDTLQQGIIRQNRKYQAENREALGVRPEYGMPVMMPPKDKAGQNWANLQMMLSIAGAGMSAASLGAGSPGKGSDIRLKENIEQIGVSPTGHKIYEWTYKSAPNTRYRGVIAQEVMKIDPMAVTIQEDNMFGVLYNKIDVDMELVS